MSALIQRVPWSVQPQSPVGINWANPLARGLISAWTPATGLVIPGGAKAVTGGSATVSVYGVGRAFNGSSDAISLGGGALSHVTGSRFALIRAGAASSTRTISAGGNGGVGFRLNSAGIDIITTGVVVVLNAPAAVAASGLYALGISYAPFDSEIFKSGVSIASNTTSAGGTNNNTDYLGQNGAGAQFFDGSLFLHLSWNRRLSAAEHAQINANPWRLFAPLPRTIWAPAAAGGGSDFTPASGVATASTMAGASTAAAAFTQAAGVATASTMAGASVAAADFVAAAGAATASTMVGDAISGGTAADFVAAAGVASASTMAGSSVAAADMVPAAGVATAATMVGADADAPVADVSVGGRRRKAKTRIERIKEFDVPLPAEVLTSTVPADKVAEPIAKPKADPASSKLAESAPRRKKPVARVNAAPSPAPIVVQTPVAPAAAAPRPMMLSDILNAETMTPQEMMAAIKMLARLQLGPQLMRSSPAKPQLIRGRG